MGSAKLTVSVLTPFVNCFRDATASNGPGPRYRGFKITLGRTPLDE